MSATTTRTKTELEELRRRNADLAREVLEGRAREERMRQELERSRERLLVVEEAEERLCGELTELEADAVETVREYSLHIKYLMEELKVAGNMLSSAGIPHNLTAIAGVK